MDAIVRGNHELTDTQTLLRYICNSRLKTRLVTYYELRLKTIVNNITKLRQKSRRQSTLFDCSQ